MAKTQQRHRTDSGGGVASSDSEGPGSHSKRPRSEAASASHHGIESPEASSTGVVPWHPGCLLPFLAPMAPPSRVLCPPPPTPRATTGPENTLPLRTSASTALTCNLLCPAFPLGDQGHFSAQGRHRPWRPGRDTT